MKRAIDYSLYLVTGRELLPDGKDYLESLEESLQGGVTVVQVREKHEDTGDFLAIALKTKEVCDKYGVPLIINDRTDIFLTLNILSPTPPVAGLHIGQSDLPLPLARRLLGNNAVIGVSCGNVHEAQTAKEQGADYIGIGAVWHTTSKALKKVALGPRHIAPIAQAFLPGPSVAIGGVKSQNIPQLLHNAPELKGVAIISEIVGARNPKGVCMSLKTILGGWLRPVVDEKKIKKEKVDYVGEMVKLLDVCKKESPVINQLTNNVVINDSANATLAIGCSPIMATLPAEVTELSLIIGAVLLNFGTISELEGMLAAGTAANKTGKPIVFDPVGGGATKVRRDAAQELLNTFQTSVIKGNAAEISSLLSAVSPSLATDLVQSKGVDSAGTLKDPGKVVRNLARREKCVVVMTGKVDWVSDGIRTVKIENGVEMLGNITGSGCMTGTLIACFCAAARLHFLSTTVPLSTARSKLVQGDIFTAAIAGVLSITIASEEAMQRLDVKGPNTFRSALIDELFGLTEEKIKKRAKVTEVTIG